MTKTHGNEIFVMKHIRHKMYSFSDENLCFVTKGISLVTKPRIHHKSCKSQEIGDEIQSLSPKGVSLNEAQNFSAETFSDY